jgi:hypothetical protein
LKCERAGFLSFAQNNFATKDVVEEAYKYLVDADPKTALSKRARCKLPSTKPKFWQRSPTPFRKAMVDYSFLRAALKK